jgi:hypothetical protein
LKSTLLQLDSTFSERTYGAGSFRDFAQKLASAGHVALRESGRNVLVELAEGSVGTAPEEPRDSRPQQYSQPQYSQPQPRREAADAPQAAPAETAGTNGGEPEPRTADGIREVRRLFQSAQNPPRWPMYIRQAKQFLRNVDASFDERKFGFASLVDLLRACQREGLFRIERDRQGVMRVFPGNIMQAAEPGAAGDDDNRGNVAAPAPVEEVSDESPAIEWSASVTSVETEVVEGAVVQEMNAEQPVLDGEATIEESDGGTQPPAPARGRSRGGRGRGKSAGAAKSASEPRSEGRRKSGDGAAPKARKTPAKPRAPRTRTRKETPAL